jgi:hypothetical protein
VMRKGKKERRKRPAEPITGHSVRELLQTRVLGSKLRMPGEADLEKLARILEGWRKNYLVEHSAEQEDIRQLQEKGKTALAMLEKLVGEIERIDRDRFIYAVEHGESLGVVDASRAHFTASTEVRKMIAITMVSSVWIDRGMGFAGWRWLGDVLREDFVNAMKPENPKFNPGIGNTGPLARFVAAVAPLVTGEHPPTVSSVAAQLKKLSV